MSKRGLYTYHYLRSWGGAAAEPPAPEVPQPWLRFSDSFTERLSIEGGKVTGYTCPYSGLVFSQPTTANQFSYTNGRVIGNGSQWLINADDVWRFLHNGEQGTVFVKFAGSPGDAASFLLGNNGGSSAKVGISMAHDNRSGIATDAFSFGVSKGTSGNLVNQGWSTHNNAFASGVNVLGYRGGLSSATQMAFDFKTQLRESSFAITNSVSAAAPTHAMHLGGLGGSTLGIIGELREVWVYRERLANDKFLQVFDHIQSLT